MQPCGPQPCPNSWGWSRVGELRKDSRSTLRSCVKSIKFWIRKWFKETKKSIGWAWRTKSIGYSCFAKYSLNIFFIRQAPWQSGYGLNFWYFRLVQYFFCFFKSVPNPKWNWWLAEFIVIAPLAPGNINEPFQYHCLLLSCRLEDLLLGHPSVRLH